MNHINQPMYQKIYDQIFEEIKAGKYAVGDRIPSEKELAIQYEVSRITSKKALEMLAKNDVISRMPGKGSFVLRDVNHREEAADGADGKREKHTLIGVVMSDFSGSYGIELLSGIEDNASQNSCSIVPRRSHGRQDIEEQAIDALIEMGVEGIIVMPVHGEHYNSKLLRLILDGFPIVLIDRDLKGIPASFAGSDNVGAAKKAADYLLGLGHRKISFISPPADTSTIEDRIEGFVKSHAEHGVVIDESIWLTSLISTLPGNGNKSNISHDIERIKEFLKENSHITCLFTIEYNIALLAVEAIKLLGMRVPEDISVLCFDGPINYTGEYFFTHIRQREYEMGATAVKYLLDQFSGKAGGDKVFLETDLILGGSTKAATPGV